MKKFYILIIILLSINSLNSQNLVLNPSFENTKRCSYYIGRLNENIVDWSTPTYGTTDLFNPCSKNNTGIPDNPTPKTIRPLRAKPEKNELPDQQTKTPAP